MKQESSQEMLRLALEVFKKSSLDWRPHSSEEDTKILIGLLNSQAKETSNSYKADTTKSELSDTRDNQWKQFQLAFCKEKYPNRSSEIDKKSIEDTLKVLEQLYIDSTKKYQKQFDVWVAMAGVAVFALSSGISLLGVLGVGIFLKLLELILHVSTIFSYKFLLFLYIVSLPFSIFSSIIPLWSNYSGFFESLRQESFFTKEIKPSLIKEVQNKDIEMVEMGPVVNNSLKESVVRRF